jgi:NAD(P)-dependent dehydrogenase (short-subunit alcohol dehydrogenase family)
MTELTADRALADTPLDRGPVVVTGGASGLGAAVVRAVQAAGGTPVVLDLGRSRRRTEAVAVDLADPAGREAAVRALAERHGGLGRRGHRCGHRRLRAPGRRGSRPLGPRDRREPAGDGGRRPRRASGPEAARGRVVTVASTLGYRALSDATAYCASKFGVVGFSRALQVELAGRVGVTLLIPGGMQTHFFDDRDPQYKPGPDADLQGPDDVAAAVLFALTRPAGSRSASSWSRRPRSRPGREPGPAGGPRARPGTRAAAARRPARARPRRPAHRGARLRALARAFPGTGGCCSRRGRWRRSSSS